MACGPFFLKPQFRRELRSAGGDQSEVRSRELLPRESEHPAGGITGLCTDPGGAMVPAARIGQASLPAGSVRRRPTLPGGVRADHPSGGTHSPECCPGTDSVKGVLPGFREMVVPRIAVHRAFLRQSGRREIPRAVRGERGHRHRRYRSHAGEVDLVPATAGTTQSQRLSVQRALSGFSGRSPGWRYVLIETLSEWATIHSVSI